MQSRAIGSIEVHEKIPQRESGEYYLGRQPGVDRFVVIRKLRADLLTNSAVVDRFKREARFAARVVHPNVLAVFDLFAARGDHYLVLEHVDGPDLREVLDWRRRMPRSLIGRIVLEVARGLAEVHARGLIHSDLRPEKISISRWGDVKLGGFAFAREANEELPPPLPRLSEYSGPLADRTLRPGHDIYALGVILAELLGLDMSGHEPTPRVRSRLERTLHKLAQRCVAEERSKRPDAAELVARLEAALPRASASETRSEIAAWLVGARKGEVILGQPSKPIPPAAPLQFKRDLPETLRTLGSPAETPGTTAQPDRRLPATWIGGAIVLLALSGGWLGMRDSTAPLAEVGQTPPVNAGRSPRSAHVRFSAYPWAEIRIDDRKPFLTPYARRVELPAGSHRVRFSHPKHGSVTREVVLEPNSETTVRHVFTGAER